MREMKWSWAELQATPHYVQRFCLDLLSIHRRVSAERADQDRPGGDR